MLHITNHSKGNKLEGFKSINTSVELNAFCQKMISKKEKGKLNTICERCYASTMEKRFNSLRSNIKDNFDILTTQLLEPKQLPLLLDRVFRLHSLGELENAIHFKNYIMLAHINPYTRFTLWTKRNDIVSEVLKTETLPNNLSLIFSNAKVNSKDIKVPQHFTKVFTNYTKQGSKDVVINCSNKCKDCMLCYSDNSVTHIRELVK